MRRIRYVEANRHTVFLTLNGTFLHKSADAECSAFRCFMRRNLRRGEEKHEVLFKCIENQGRSGTANY